MDEVGFKAVAVITRTMKRPVVLWRALESIANQTFQDLVWVIVNDGPAEPVEEVVAAARRRGLAVIVFHNTENRGGEAASNKGIRASRSRYVIIHDDDDSWDERFLAVTTAYLDSHSEAGGVVTLSCAVGEEQRGEAIVPVVIGLQNPNLTSVTAWKMAHTGQFPPISFLYRRAVFDIIGYYDEESVPKSGDWDFHLRFVERFTIDVIPQPLAFWHFRRNLQGGDYGNSWTDGTGIDLWRRYATICANDLLRRDLRAGRLGIGFLAGLMRGDSLIQAETRSLSTAVTGLRPRQ